MLRMLAVAMLALCCSGTSAKEPRPIYWAVLISVYDENTEDWINDCDVEFQRFDPVTLQEIGDFINPDFWVPGMGATFNYRVGNAMCDGQPYLFAITVTDSSNVYKAWLGGANISSATSNYYINAPLSLRRH